eukprot:scaffold17728_cov62-Phaeocystis_antarctica.AAC.5
MLSRVAAPAGLRVAPLENARTVATLPFKQRPAPPFRGQSRSQLERAVELGEFVCVRMLSRVAAPAVLRVAEHGPASLRAVAPRPVEHRSTPPFLRARRQTGRGLPAALCRSIR